jgi:predicted secreted Zn-dependent protease
MMLVALALAVLQGPPTYPRGSPSETSRKPQVAPVASPTAVAPLTTFRDLPNVVVTYYDVTGRTVPQIHTSLTGAAPRDPESRKPIPATSSWSIGAAVRWSKTGVRCTITGVTLKFTATASLPRLVVQEKTPAPVLAAWNGYVAQLEARQAAQLKFAYDRRDEVERAILASSCESWQAAADAALTRLEEQQHLARDADPSAQPKLEQPKD